VKLTGLGFLRQKGFLTGKQMEKQKDSPMEMQMETARWRQTDFQMDSPMEMQMETARWRQTDFQMDSPMEMQMEMEILKLKVIKTGWLKGFLKAKQTGFLKAKLTDSPKGSLKVKQTDLDFLKRKDSRKETSTDLQRAMKMETVKDWQTAI
jgi:hypothetical protein